MYTIRVEFCNQKAGELRLTEARAYDVWATCADSLLTGVSLGASMDRVGEGGHPIRVMLLWEPETAKLKAKPDFSDAVIVASVALICECYAEIDRERRAQSSLISG